MATEHTAIVAPAEALPEGYESFRVAVAATTLVTGGTNTHNGKPEVVRLLRGDEIRAPRTSESVQTLLSFRAIVPADKFEGKDTFLTARRIFMLHRRAAEITDAELQP